MDMYKKASRLKLKIQTPKGLLTVEQVWGLTLTELDNLAVELEKQFEASGGKSFIRKTSEKDALAKLRFEIVVDILNTLMEEDDTARSAQEKKAHNAKIDALIASKKEKSLENLSIDELEKLRM